jgi:molybdopterin biosynthesis enzyme
MNAEATGVRLDALLPPEMAQRAEDIGVKKAGLGLVPMFALAVLAGAFIALGAAFATTVAAGSMAVKGADAVIMLRIQHERIGDPLIPNTREYSKYWGLNAKKAGEWLKPEAVILHPGPINRGVELSSDVADGPRSVILDQVQNGVAVRMAILYLLAGGAGDARPEKV